MHRAPESASVAAGGTTLRPDMLAELREDNKTLAARLH